jgi:ABC-type nitrate/sulfonate/bicarbonate transport system substrate-binding protein
LSGPINRAHDKACEKSHGLSKERVVRKMIVTGLAVLLHAAHGLAVPAEPVKVAVTDNPEWDTSFTQLGLQQGFFQQRGLAVEIVRVANEASLEKVLISGDADIAVAAPFPDIVAACANGAPIKIISPEATGAPDIFWFAKVGGPITSMRDLHSQPVGFEGPGTLNYFVLQTLLKQAGVDDARLIPVKPADNGIGLVLNAQLFASWGGPVAVAKDLLAGEVRLIGRGNDSPLVQNETMRVNVANAKFLEEHRAAVLAFLKGYRASVDWAYSGQAPVEAYAKLSNQPFEFAKYIVREFASKATNQLGEIKGEDRVLGEAVASKHLPNTFRRQDLWGAYDLVLRNGS